MGPATKLTAADIGKHRGKASQDHLVKHTHTHTHTHARARASKQASKQAKQRRWRPTANICIRFHSQHGIKCACLYPFV